MNVKHDGKDIVIMLIWVYGIVVAPSNVSMLDEVKAMLSQKFKRQSLHFLAYFKAEPDKYGGPELP